MLVLAGYLAALAATPTGQGLGLLGHLAAEHGPAPLAAPALVVGTEAAGPAVLPTLREVHRHGDGPVHSHDDPGDAARHRHRPAPVLVLATPPAQREARAGWLGGADLHEHDGVVHSHAPAPPEPAVVQAVSLDKHRLPEAARVPAPPTSTAAAAGRGGVGLSSVSLSVETPPPIGRG